MPKTTAHPYVSWRNGRPRFNPSPQLRAQGHKGRDLRHDDGRWFSRGECVDWSETLLALPLAREGAAHPAPVVRRPQRGVSLGLVCEHWLAQPRFAGHGQRPLAAATARDYRQKLKAFQDDNPDLWVFEADKVTSALLQDAYDQMEEARGLHTARQALGAIATAYKWAITRGRIRREVNPAIGLEKHMPKPRIRFGTRTEMHGLIAAADASGRPDVGDAVMLGLWSGQRQGDRLALTHKGVLKGRRVFRQAKTGAIVHVLEAPELEARLARALERRGMASIVNPHVLLNERTWKPWNADTYRHEFRAVVKRAIADGCVSLADFHDADLRDTAVTWMALAEATIPEIAAVTGHQVNSVHQILKHYLARHPEMADSAIRKMIAWYDRGGETEFG